MTNPRDDLIALAPCPFCGGEAERIDIPTVGSDPDLGGDPNAGGSCISCKRCAASTALHFDRKENLYSSWNDRAAQVVNRETVARIIKRHVSVTVAGVAYAPRDDVMDGVASAADAILSLLRPAEPVDAIRPDTVAQRTWFDGENIRTENLTADDIYQKPTTTDDVGEPVAWRARRLEWIERIGVDGTFDASTSIGHYIATITDDGRGMWFVVGLTTSNYIDGDISAVQFAAQSDYENRIRSAIEVAPHPPASPDTSAAVIQSHALKQALDSLAEISAARIPDCPAHYAGDELSWAQRHVGSLRLKAEIARDGIAAAIREAELRPGQLPTPERGGVS